MSLSLQILNGPRSNETLYIENPTTLGREAEISFNDPKMSKIHAIFEYDMGVGWLLKDPGSKNGILVNDHKTKQHLLSPGDIIDLGATQFRVVSVATTWKPLLNQLLLESLDTVKNHPMPLMPFRTLPVLSIVQGLQTGEKHLLEYGPRSIGGDCDDIILFEPKCPDIAFSVVPTAQGALFETKYPQIVKLNGTSELKKVLKSTDQIFIHNTVIEVSFVST